MRPGVETDVLDCQQSRKVLSEDIIFLEVYGPSLLGYMHPFGIDDLWAFFFSGGIRNA